MKRGRTRKLTPTLLTESRGLVQAMQLQAAILAKRHPQLTEVLIITQQLAALAGTFNHQAAQNATDNQEAD